MRTLLVTGAGSLAEATLFALSQRPGPIEAIAIAARNTERLRWLARSTSARIGLAGSSPEVRAYPIDWDDEESLVSALSSTAPQVVLHTASWQSPWTLGRPDPWSALVRDIGYGVTLPLQRVLAERLGRVVAEHAPGASFVNACFPDAVNQLLVRRGIAIACGIGNVAILAAMLTAELDHSALPLRLVAHHSHVSAAITGRPPATGIRGWRGDAGIDEKIAAWLAGTRLPGDQRLNAITGATAVPLLHALMEGSFTYRGHAPGPLGLCGGYPISITGGAVALDLPQGISSADASAHNITAAASDGLLAHADGQLGWSPRALAILDSAPATIRDTLRWVFDDSDVEASACRVRELRDHLTTGYA